MYNNHICLTFILFYVFRCYHVAQADIKLLILLCIYLFSLNLKLDWLPEGPSNPPVSSPNCVSVTGVYGLT